MLGLYQHKLAPSATGLIRCKSAWPALMLAVSLQAWSQSAQPCQYNSQISMAQVLAESRSGSGEKLAANITTCHVNFKMDIATLDQLVGERIPAQVTNEINRDTASRLTLEEAHREVDRLEAYLRGSSSGSGIGVGQTRAKLDTEYLAHRAALLQVPVKDEFETTAQYEDRKKRSRDGIAELDKTYDREIKKYYEIFNARIRIIKMRTYPIAAQSVYRSYDADSQQLSVLINGEEYFFLGVEPDAARSLKENWQTVQTGRRYDDDGSRFLFFSVIGPRYLGQTAKAIQDQLAVGVWVNSKTGLMWTTQISDSAVVFRDALEYCQSLRTGGFSDWGLPAIEDFAGITGTSSYRTARNVWSSTMATFGDGDWAGFWRFGVPNGPRIPAPKPNPFLGGPDRGFVLCDRNTDRSATSVIPLLPQSVAIGEAVRTLLDVAEDQKSRKDFDGADKSYRAALAKDPNNSDAKAGIEEIQLLKAKQAQLAARLNSVGAWLDAQIIWTIHDSDQNLTWPQADEYCKALNIGGLTGWRLPTAKEFRNIYDPSAAPKKFQKHVFLGGNGNEYNLRGPFDLKGSSYWISTRETYMGNYAYGNWFAPSNGSVNKDMLTTKSGYRALCVRDFQAATDVPALHP